MARSCRMPRVRENTSRGSEVCASVSVRSGGGLFGRVAESATAALLKAGALGVAVDRIAASATA